MFSRIGGLHYLGVKPIVKKTSTVDTSELDSVYEIKKFKLRNLIGDLSRGIGKRNRELGGENISVNFKNIAENVPIADGVIRGPGFRNKKKNPRVNNEAIRLNNTLVDGFEPMVYEWRNETTEDVESEILLPGELENIFDEYGDEMYDFDTTYKIKTKAKLNTPFWLKKNPLISTNTEWSENQQDRMSSKIRGDHLRAINERKYSKLTATELGKKYQRLDVLAQPILNTENVKNTVGSYLKRWY